MRSSLHQPTRMVLLLLLLRLLGLLLKALALLGAHHLGGGRNAAFGGREPLPLDSNLLRGGRNARLAGESHWIRIFSNLLSTRVSLGGIPLHSLLFV